MGSFLHLSEERIVIFIIGSNWHRYPTLIEWRFNIIWSHLMPLVPRYCSDVYNRVVSPCNLRSVATVAIHWPVYLQLRLCFSLATMIVWWIRWASKGGNSPWRKQIDRYKYTSSSQVQKKYCQSNPAGYESQSWRLAVFQCDPIRRIPEYAGMILTQG